MLFAIVLHAGAVLFVGRWPGRWRVVSLRRVFPCVFESVWAILGVILCFDVVCSIACAC